MYYRLFDYDTKNYMHTGYNATSEANLIEELISYLEPDKEMEDIELMRQMSAKDLAITFFMLVEESETPFEELDLDIEFN